MTVHKTAMGKPVDMAALAARNDKTRAVGNMNVNAKGDIIDSHDNVISDVTKRVNQNYMRTVVNRMDPANVVKPTRPPQPARQQVSTPQPDVVPESEFSAEEQQFDAEDIFEEKPKSKK